MPTIFLTTMLRTERHQRARKLPLLLRLRFYRLDMAARLATVGDEFWHGADPGHPANGSQPFAVAGAILRQIAKQIRFHTPKNDGS